LVLFFEAWGSGVEFCFLLLFQTCEVVTHLASKRGATKWPDCGGHTAPFLVVLHSLLCPPPFASPQTLPLHHSYKPIIAPFCTPAPPLPNSIALTVLSFPPSVLLQSSPPFQLHEAGYDYGIRLLPYNSEEVFLWG
jgi:hypothetical protein